MPLVIPGSHRPSDLPGAGPARRPVRLFPQEAYAFPYRDEDAIPVELPAGAAVLFHGYLLHRSLPNTGRHGMRRALVNHYMSADSVLPWFPPGEGEAMGLLTTGTSSSSPARIRTPTREPLTSCAPTYAPTATADARGELRRRRSGSEPCQGATRRGIAGANSLHRHARRQNRSKLRLHDLSGHGRDKLPNNPKDPSPPPAG